MDPGVAPRTVLEGLEPRLLMSGAMIVTNAALSSAFEEVADWYTRKGYATEVVTTESIYAGYSGADNQESIRNCIRDYHENHDVRYVLLGGDNTIVPDRNTKVSVGSYSSSTIPTDLYYSSLSGTWDTDGDGIYGEAGQDTDIVIGSIDTIVARYPIRTASHVATLLGKVIAYETAPPSSNWATSMLGAGDRLWNEYAAGPYNGITFDHAASDAEIKTFTAEATYVSPYWADHTLDYIFDTATSWDSSTAGDYALNAGNLWSAMGSGNGYQFMHMATHGSSTSWGLESGSFSSNSVYGMSQEVNVPIVSTIACNTGAFDSADSSLSEAFLRSDKTGTVVYLGSSRYGWGYASTALGTSFRYSYEFYKQFLTGDSQTAGEVFADTKSYYASQSSYNGSYRWAQFSLNFQGDPLVQMYRSDPDTLDPTHEAGVHAESQQYEVSGLPGGARVCLWQGDDLYVVGEADGSGVFTANITPVVGTMKLTVIAPDAAVYTADVEVTASEDPPYYIDGNSLIVLGSGENDTFTFLAGLDMHTVTLNGQTWTFDASQITSIQFLGGGGADTAYLTGAAGIDTAVLQNGYARLFGATYSAIVESSETIEVFGHSDDIAYFLGTPGDEAFTGRTNRATMAGDGYESSATGFGRVRADASQGGNDRAYLYDSAGDDVFLGYADYSVMHGSGVVMYVEGFDRVDAYSVNGGSDVALLYDSAGSDEFHGHASYAYFAGDDFHNQANGFARVLAYSTAGGVDRAYLYDSAGDDVFAATDTYGYLSGAGFVNCALGFASVYAYSAGGGNDVALLYDSAGDDTFRARSDYSYMSGSTFYNRAEGFGSVIARSTAGGLDTAFMYDSAGDDRFVATDSYSYMSGTGFVNYAIGFDRVYAYATAGGSDRALLFDSADNDTFWAWSSYCYMSGRGFYNYASGFDRVYAYATAGGEDRAYLYDSAGDDIFVARHNQSYIAGTNFLNCAYGFDRVEARATAGGFDAAFLHDSPGDETFYAWHDYGYMTGDGFYSYAGGFDRLHAYSTAGNDRAYLYDSAGDDVFTATAVHGYLSGTGFVNCAVGFGAIYAYSTAGGNDLAVMYDSAGDDTFSGRQDHICMEGSGFSNYAYGFGRTYAYATGGGLDTAYLYDSAGDDVFVARRDYGYLDGTDSMYCAVGFDRVYAYASDGDDEAYLFDAAGNTLIVDDVYWAVQGPDFYNHAQGFDHIHTPA